MSSTPNLPAAGFTQVLRSTGRAMGQKNMYLQRYDVAPELPCQLCEDGVADDIEFEGDGFWMSSGICKACNDELEDRDKLEAEAKREKERREAFARKLEAAGVDPSILQSKYPLDPRWTRFMRRDDNTDHDHPRAWGAWIWGDPGTGKSTETGLIVRHYLAQGWTARFASEMELVKSLEKGGGMTREAWCAYDLLVLDDLGARDLATWEHDKIAEVIDQRMCRFRSPTILTSNMPLMTWANSQDAYKGRSLERVLVAIGGAAGHHVERTEKFRAARMLEIEL